MVAAHLVERGGGPARAAPRTRSRSSTSHAGWPSRGQQPARGRRSRIGSSGSADGVPAQSARTAAHAPQASRAALAASARPPANGSCRRPSVDRPRARGASRCESVSRGGGTCGLRASAPSGASRSATHAARPQGRRRVAHVLDAAVRRRRPGRHAAVDVEEVGHVRGGDALLELRFDPLAKLLRRRCRGPPSESSSRRCGRRAVKASYSARSGPRRRGPSPEP